MPIFDHAHPKTIEITFSFPELHQHTKNQFISSIHSWDTVNFRVLQPEWQHPFLTIPSKTLFDQLLIYVNLYLHAKNHFINLFWRYNWLKNPAI